MRNDLIIISEYCYKCKIDPSFLLMLEENGLIDIYIDNTEKYLLTSQLADLGKYIRLYYDLSINIPGIDAIHHLLAKINSMQDEIHLLKSKLSIYRNTQIEEIEEMKELRPITK
ncbi:MAG: chaperone modulator CbpM [Bacteroides sp.]